MVISQFILHKDVYFTRVLINYDTTNRHSNRPSVLIRYYAFFLESIQFHLSIFSFGLENVQFASQVFQEIWVCFCNVCMSFSYIYLIRFYFKLKKNWCYLRIFYVRCFLLLQTFTLFLSCLIRTQSFPIFKNRNTSQ